MHIPYCFCFGTNVYCLTKYENLICYKVCILLLNQVSCMSIFPLVSCMNMHIPIVLCCGVKSLPTSYQSIGVIIPVYQVSYIQAFIGKRVTQTCMFTLFFVVV